MIVQQNGKIVIMPNGDIDHGDVQGRVNAILSLIAIADPSRLDQNMIYFAVSMVEDMLPDGDLWMKLSQK